MALVHFGLIEALFTNTISSRLSSCSFFTSSASAFPSRSYLPTVRARFHSQRGASEPEWSCIRIGRVGSSILSFLGGSRGNNHSPYDLACKYRFWHTQFLYGHIRMRQVSSAVDTFNVPSRGIAEVQATIAPTHNEWPLPQSPRFCRIAASDSRHRRLRAHCSHW